MPTPQLVFVSSICRYLSQDWTGGWPADMDQLRGALDAGDIVHGPESGDEPPVDLDVLLRWLDVRTAEGRAWPENARRLLTEAQHSLRGGLLGWMVEGNEPLPEPPPLAMSSPQHALVLAGRGDPFSVWEAGPWERALYNFPVVFIDQHPWKLAQRLGTTGDAWTVQPFRGQKEPRYDAPYWLVRCIGSRLDTRDTPDASASFSKLWELVRLGDRTPITLHAAKEPGMFIARVLIGSVDIATQERGADAALRTLLWNSFSILGIPAAEAAAWVDPDPRRLFARYGYTIEE